MSPRAARRLLAAGLALLAGCAGPAAPPPPAPVAAAPTAPLCRIGADDGPPAPLRLAERGIGGTGISAEEGGDRGIGGTGIVGVLTGFASLCVNGLEVGTDAQAAEEPAAGLRLPLRAGQVVVVEAGGPAEALRARSLALRLELVGPVEAVTEDGLRVAGQVLRLEPGFRGRRDWRPGEWVAVSGLRRPDGSIGATRLDAAPPGRVLLRGIARRQGGTLRVGGLPVRSSLAMDVPTGIPLLLAGPLQDGVLLPDRVEIDWLQAEPERHFGPGIGRIVIEAYVGLEAGTLRLGAARLPAAGLSAGGTPRRAVLDARRQGDGRLAPQELRAPGQAPGARDTALPGLPGAGRPGAAGRGGAPAGRAMPGRGGEDAGGRPPGAGGGVPGGMGPGGMGPMGGGPGGAAGRP
ncbi:DUF5666 domain-containing protein [Pseudoroseomonas cervicalis]|uniref:DUF5666 domain-containing protein n=1 Tax=Teichococcus cervicalis TaxID=204525 RepID=UPI0022F1C785|nr:DUF5666 domain-containing protein [Pseudoroseomonas cervicalis]WBV45134.1 DUF5666 domain-containing protein [Pseudoroseomonas cervicalis]